MKHHDDQNAPQQKTPLWKWLVMILMIVSLPCFFLQYRTAQIQRALIQTDPQTEPPADK